MAKHFLEFCIPNMACNVNSQGVQAIGTAAFYRDGRARGGGNQRRHPARHRSRKQVRSLQLARSEEPPVKVSCQSRPFLSDLLRIAAGHCDEWSRLTSAFSRVGFLRRDDGACPTFRLRPAGRHKSERTTFRNNVKLNRTAERGRDRSDANAIRWRLHNAPSTRRFNVNQAFV